MDKHRRRAQADADVVRWMIGCVQHAWGRVRGVRESGIIRDSSSIHSQKNKLEMQMISLRSTLDILRVPNPADLMTEKCVFSQGYYWKRQHSKDHCNVKVA